MERHFLEADLREKNKEKYIHNACYFYILNHSEKTKYQYEGQGMLRNLSNDTYVESQTEKIKPGYIVIKSLESETECAISGLNGQYYKINDFQHVYFSRNEGKYILQLRNKDSKKPLRFLVQSGRGYFVVNNQRVLDMVSNMDLIQYQNEDNLNMIEMEAETHREFIKQRKEVANLGK